MFQRLFSIFQNSFFTAINLLLILILTLLVIVSAVLYLPTSLGEQPNDLHIDEIYHFPSLKLTNFNYLDIEYNTGGFLVPAYNYKGTIKGFAIIGDGSYQFFPPDSSYRDKGELTEIYIPIQEERLPLLLLEADFTEITSRNQVIDSNNKVIDYQDDKHIFDEIRNKAALLFEKESNLFISIQLFGYKRVYTPSADVVIALLKTVDQQYLQYNENRTVSLQNLLTNEMHFDVINPTGTVEYPPKNMLIYATITTSLLFVASIILIWLLTVDIDEKKRFHSHRQQIDYPHWLIVLTILFYFSSQLILSDYHVLDYQSLVLTFLLYLLIFFAFCKNADERNYIGLNFYNWAHSISAAILLAFFFQILGTFNIPSSFAIDSYLDLLKLFLITFFLQALLSELVFRGIIQNYIERLSNMFVALVVTAGIVSIIKYITTTYIYQLATTEVLIQSFLIAPFGSMVLGLLYIRTRSILASALLATLLIILPKILVF